MSQNLKALARGNEIRLARSKVRHWLHDVSTSAEARRRVATILRDPPSCIDTMAVFDLLRAGYRIPRTTIRRCLALARVSEAKRIGTMTERQRQCLASLVLYSITGRMAKERSGNEAEAPRSTTPKG